MNVRQTTDGHPPNEGYPLWLGKGLEMRLSTYTPFHSILSMHFHRIKKKNTKPPFRALLPKLGRATGHKHGAHSPRRHTALPGVTGAFSCSPTSPRTVPSAPITSQQELWLRPQRWPHLGWSQAGFSNPATCPMGEPRPPPSHSPASSCSHVLCSSHTCWCSHGSILGPLPTRHTMPV